jgi:hypothetical protein
MPPSLVSGVDRELGELHAHTVTSIWVTPGYRWLMTTSPAQLDPLLRAKEIESRPAPVVLEVMVQSP